MSLVLNFVLLDMIKELSFQNFLWKYNSSVKLYLPLSVFVSQRIVWSSEQLKQMIQIEHNIVKTLPLARGKQGSYLQSWPRIQTRGYSETNPGDGKSRTRTQDHDCEFDALTTRTSCS